MLKTPAVNEEADEEEEASLLNVATFTKPPTYEVPWDLHVWSRNPFFYIYLLSIIFSIMTFIINASWSFVFGISISVISLVFSFWMVIYIFSMYKRHLRFTLYQLGKLLLSLIIFTGFLGVLLYFQTDSTIFHFSAPDPSWNDFPPDCIRHQGNPPFNCIRIGRHIENQVTTTGGLEFPPYKTSLQTAKTVFQTIVVHELACQIVSQIDKNLSMVMHYRCLTPILGYPDDFVLKLYCENSLVILWVHSQSRLGIWDHNVNDARVRLLWNTINTTLFSYNSSLNDGEICTPISNKFESFS
jgi:uncharacterized protein (DUF1499 family)